MFEIGHTVNSGREAKPRYVQDAIIRTLRQNPEKLRQAIEAQLNAAAAGDLPALDWLTCRIEGKANQQVNVDSTLAISVTTDRPRLSPDQWLMQHGIVDAVPMIEHEIANVINELAQDGDGVTIEPGEKKDALG